MTTRYFIVKIRKRNAEMASKANIIDPKRLFVLVFLTLPLKTASTNIDCNGKSFRCINSTHFMICVDLGGGVSSTVDSLVIPCPPTTICQTTNRFECEFPAIETTTEVITFATTVVTRNQWMNVDDTTTVPKTHLEEYTEAKNFTTLFPSKATADLEATTEAYVSGATSDTIPTEIIFDINNERVTTDVVTTDKAMMTSAPQTVTPQSNPDTTKVASPIQNTFPNLTSDMYPIQTMSNTYNGSNNLQFPSKGTIDLEVTSEAYVSDAKSNTNHTELILKEAMSSVVNSITEVTRTSLTDTSTQSNTDITKVESSLEKKSPNTTSEINSIQTTSNNNNESTSAAQSYPNLTIIALAMETTSPVPTSDIGYGEVTSTRQIGASKVQPDITTVPFASEITTLAPISGTLSNDNGNNISDVLSVSEVPVSTESLLFENSKSNTNVPENMSDITGSTTSDIQNNSEGSTEPFNIGSMLPDVTTDFIPQVTIETTTPFYPTASEHATEPFTVSYSKSVTVTSSYQNTPITVSTTVAMTETSANTDGINGPTVAIIEISYGNSTENIIDMNPTEVYSTKITTKSYLEPTITGKEELINETIDNALNTVFNSTIENTYPNVSGTTVTQSYLDGITESILTDTTLSASFGTKNTTKHTLDSSTIFEKTNITGLENTTVVTEPNFQMTTNYVITDTTTQNPTLPVIDFSTNNFFDRTTNIELGTTKIKTDSVLDIPTPKIQTHLSTGTETTINTGLGSTTATSNSVLEATTNFNTIVLEVTSSNTVTESTKEPALDSSIISYKTTPSIELETSKITTDPALNMVIPTTLQAITTSIPVTIAISEADVANADWPAIHPNTFPVYYTQSTEDVTSVYHKETPADISVVPNLLASSPSEVVSTKYVVEDSTMRTTMNSKATATTSYGKNVLINGEHKNTVKYFSNSSPDIESTDFITKSSKFGWIEIATESSMTSSKITTNTDNSVTYITSTPNDLFVTEPSKKSTILPTTSNKSTIESTINAYISTVEEQILNTATIPSNIAQPSGFPLVTENISTTNTSLHKTTIVNSLVGNISTNIQQLVTEPITVTNTNTFTDVSDLTTTNEVTTKGSSTVSYVPHQVSNTGTSETKDTRTTSYVISENIVGIDDGTNITTPKFDGASTTTNITIVLKNTTPITPNVHSVIQDTTSRQIDVTPVSGITVTEDTFVNKNDKLLPNSSLKPGIPTTMPSSSSLADLVEYMEPMQKKASLTTGISTTPFFPEKNLTTSSKTVENKARKFDCTNQKIGIYPDNVDCKIFHECNGIDTDSVDTDSCPENTVFSSFKKKCTKDLSHCIRNKEFKCVSEGRFYDYLEPNVYYICVKNTFTNFYVRFKFQCQNGYHFNKKSIKCELNQSTTVKTSTEKISAKVIEASVIDSQKSVEDSYECEDEEGFSCKNLGSGKYVDNNDCGKFYACYGPHLAIGKCPPGTVFSDIKKQCTTDLSHCIRNKQFKCVSEGRFYDYFAPNVYYVCVKNTQTNAFVRFKFQCQKGYNLAKKTVKCEKEENTATKQGLDLINKEGIKKSTKKPKKGKTESDNDFECEKSGKYRDPHDCQLYYVCSETSSDEFKRSKKKCDSDEVFHEDKKECVDAESYSCS